MDTVGRFWLNCQWCSRRYKGNSCTLQLGGGWGRWYTDRTVALRLCHACKAAFTSRLDEVVDRPGKRWQRVGAPVPMLSPNDLDDLATLRGDAPRSRPVRWPRHNAAYFRKHRGADRSDQAAD